MSEKRVLTVRSAADAAAVSVVALGAVPTESVVFLAANAGCPTVRMDLPSSASDGVGVAQTLARVVELCEDAPALVAVAFAADATAAEWAFLAAEAVPGVELLACVRVESDCVRRRIAAGVYDVPEPFDVMTHPQSREALLRGAVTLAGHAEVSEEFTGVGEESPGVAAQVRAVTAAAEALGEREPEEVAAKVWQVIGHDGDDGSERVDALPVEDVALLVAVAASVPHRDAVLASSDWERSVRAAEVFRVAGQSVPGQWAGRAFTMSAVYYMSAGRGLFARHAAEAAVRLAPACGLAPLVAEGLAYGIAPEALRRVISG